MTTINGVTFNMQTLEPISVVRNIPSDQPGSDENFVTHMGYRGLVLRVEGFEESLADYDNVISEFMKPGEQTLIHRTGWQFKVHSAQLSPILMEGIVDNYFPYELVLLTGTPYRESTSETTRSKTVTTNNQEWTQDDSSNDIDTDGSVDALPDIKVTGGATHPSIIQSNDDSNYNMNNSASTVTITQSSSDGLFTLGPTYKEYSQTVNCRKAGMAIIDSIQIDVVDTPTAGDCTCNCRDSLNGTILGTKTINISSGGLKTFTFPTPIAVVQDENTCADSTDTKKICFELVVTGSTSLRIRMHDTPSTYPDGELYRGTTLTTADLKFVISGHSCKEIRQTFEVEHTLSLSKVILELCKYNYSGNNSVTLLIKDGATILGRKNVTLSGSTFVEVDFEMWEESAHSLVLSPGTTYTMVITPPSDSGNATPVLIKTKTTSVYADGAVTLVEDGGTTRAQTHDLLFKMYFSPSNIDLEIYNTANTTVKCAATNEILDGAIHRINVDGTGTIFFDDDFTTDKWIYTNEGMKAVYQDEVNDELDIQYNAYIYWKCDPKYPIAGIPTLTSRINITTGTSQPTIQISEDAITWYDIDTAIVDDVETVYKLDSSSLSLDGLTKFYWRFDCVKTWPSVCAIKNFELNAKMSTIDVEHPKINSNGASTIRCDQDDDSGMACVIALIYRDRSWPV